MNSNIKKNKNLKKVEEDYEENQQTNDKRRNLREAYKVLVEKAKCTDKNDVIKYF